MDPINLAPVDSNEAGAWIDLFRRIGPNVDVLVAGAKKPVIVLLGKLRRAQIVVPDPGGWECECRELGLPMICGWDNDCRCGRMCAQVRQQLLAVAEEVEREAQLERSQDAFARSLPHSRSVGWN
jgi:hypothetical protein